MLGKRENNDFVQSIVLQYCFKRVMVIHVPMSNMQDGVLGGVLE